MADEKTASLDLLGDPVQSIRDPRGRRSAVGSAGIRKEIQTVVMTLRAAGQSQADIANYLRMDEKTLRKYFSRELDGGASLLEGMAMQVLVKKMLDGNVSAAKAVREIASARAAPKATPKDAGKKAAPLGKKQELDRSANEPPQGWNELLKLN